MKHTDGKIYNFCDWLKRVNMDKHNFKIQFVEATWVLQRIGGGFDGYYITKAVEVGTEPMGVLQVEKNKKKQCSDIWVWSDGMCDGYRCYYINVPNGLFRQIHE